VTKQVIITGDDFGLAEPVNEAIEQAYQHGILTTTSLLIASPAAADAVLRAQRNPGLRVGLHLAVCEGVPVLPAQAIPALVDARGELWGPIAAALRFFMFFFLPGARRQLEAEIRAQFAAFQATGLGIDHVNGHNNMQMHPVVLPILARVAREFGVRAVRVSFEPLLSSARAARLRGLLSCGVFRRPRTGLLLRFVQWCVLRPWGAYVRFRYRRAGFIVNDFLFGMYDCGGMDLDLLVGTIRNLPDGLSEIHCHPASGRCPELTRPMPDYQQQAELAALVSREAREALADSGVQSLRGFGDLSAAS